MVHIDLRLLQNIHTQSMPYPILMSEYSSAWYEKH